VRVKIELSGKEPRPDGVAAELTFGGGGAGHGYSGNRQDGVYWIGLPKPLSAPTDFGFWQPVELVACGYISNQPTGTVTTPFGTQQYIYGEQIEVPAEGGKAPLGCWLYTVSWTYGMELGLYTLTLNGNEGPLSHTWGMDYDYCRTTTHLPGYIYFISSGQQDSWLFTGFPPNQTITIHFYADSGRAAAQDSSLGISEYIATRNFQTDAEGTFMLDITVTRSAPYAGKGIQYQIEGYSNERRVTSLVSVQHPDNLACSIDYRIAQPNRPVIPLYPAIDDLSQTVASFSPQQTADIIEVVPALRNGKVGLWIHIRTDTGQEGWTQEPDLPGVVQNN
jgi:hypothetical protein